MASAYEGLFTTAWDTFDSLLKDPGCFLRPNQKLSNKLKETTKALYDTDKSKRAAAAARSSVLPQLVIDGFDDEQIWQELELQNDAFSRHFVTSISRIYAANNRDTDQADVPTITLGRVAVAASDGDDDDEADQPEDELDDDAGSDAELSSDADSLLGKSNGDDDIDYGSMSEDEIMMEKALDNEMSLNQEQDSDEDDKKVENSEEKIDDGENDTAVSAEHPDLLERADSDKLKKKKSKSLPKSEGGLTAPRGRRSVVDDQFFKLSEMENFLNLEDEKEMKTNAASGDKEDEDADDEEEPIDLFGEVPSSESDDSDHDDQARDKRHNKGILKSKYMDFFGQADVSDDPMETNEEEETEVSDNPDAAKWIAMDQDQPSEVKSTFEQQQELLRNRIVELEESNLADKPWQLKGETTAADRPENSILQEHLQFDHLSRPAPVITEETTLGIEQIIKQRIKDQTWDNVERKIKPTEDHMEYKKRIILDQEKSKLSLAEIYEQQYIKQQQTEKVDDEKEDEARVAIKKRMEGLFARLDALTNFHFVPKPPVPDIKIVNNLPAITVEDVAPVGVSDAALLAPEEIKEKSKREVKSTEEKSHTDRLRERRTKKSKQKHKRKDKEARKNLIEKMKPGLGNKYSKINALKDLEKSGKVDIQDKKSKTKNESLKSSKTFFSKLQEEVQTSIQAKKAEKRNKDSAHKISVAKFKL